MHVPPWGPVTSEVVRAGHLCPQHQAVRRGLPAGLCMDRSRPGWAHLEGVTPGSSYLGRERPASQPRGMGGDMGGDEQSEERRTCLQEEHVVCSLKTKA